MASPLRFSDHPAFHRQVLRLTLAAAALGVATCVLGWLVATNGRFGQVVLLGLGSAVLGLAAAPPLRRGRFQALCAALGFGLLGALAGRALAAADAPHPWFGVWVCGLSVGLIAGRDLAWGRRLLLAGATGLSVALASWVEGVFRAEVALAGYVPALLAEAGYRAGYGFLVSIGLAARYLAWHRDPVAQAFEEVRPSLSGEMLTLAEQALALYSKTQQVLRDRQAQGNETEPALARAVEDLVLRIFATGHEWQAVERGTGRTSAESLTARIEDLERRIGETSDEVARKQYALARQALTTQLKYLQEISRNRERVTARVHNYLAALERLHLALWNHRGTDAAKLSDEVQPILDEIEDVGHEMEFASAALNEVVAASEGGPAEKGPAPAPSGASSDAPSGASSDALSGASSDAPSGAPSGASSDAESKLAARAFE